MERLVVSRCDGARAAALADPVCALYDRAFAGPPHQWTATEFDRHRLAFDAVLSRPGIELATAESDGELVGATYGYPLGPADDWWGKIEGQLPLELTEEWPGRTFLISGLAVDPECRRTGIGYRIIECLLADRIEKRATYSVLSGAIGVHSLIGQPKLEPVGRRVFPPGAPISSLSIYVLELPVKKP